MEADPICPLCERAIPRGARASLHHLVPRMKGGRNGPTVLLHQTFHSMIHATLSEADLARRFATIPALRAHPEIARFIAWVRTKPPVFHARTHGARRRRR